MKNSLTFFLLFFTLQSWSQQTEASMKPSLWLSIWDEVKTIPGFNVLQIGYNDIPRELPIKGVLVEALEFSDKNGLNLVVCTQTGKFPVSTKNAAGVYEKQNDRAELSFYHLVKTGNTYMVMAEFNDGQDCDGFDLYAGFTKKSLSITDLDKDNVAEISFQMVKSCRSDVSPAERKLLLYEDGKCFVLTGETTLEGEQAKMPNYSSGTKESVFLTYLTKKWK